MKTTNAAQGNGFAALSIAHLDTAIDASIDDIGLSGLVEFRAQIDVRRGGERPLDTTNRRWFATQDAAAAWITAQIQTVIA